MSTEMIYRYGLRLGGGIILLIGLGHIAMPTMGYPPDIVSGWSAAALDHFYYLATYFICAALISIGGLSLAYASLAPSAASALFAAAMAGLWAVRFALEMLYPVDVPIYFVETPHTGIVVAVAVAAASYTMAAIAAWKIASRPRSGEDGMAFSR